MQHLQIILTRFSADNYLLAAALLLPPSLDGLGSQLAIDLSLSERNLNIIPLKFLLILEFLFRVGVGFVVLDYHLGR